MMMMAGTDGHGKAFEFPKFGFCLTLADVIKMIHQQAFERLIREHDQFQARGATNECR